MKKWMFIIPAVATGLFSCHNGEHAGAGSDQNPSLTPTPGGASIDTSKVKTDTGTLKPVDTTAAYSPTDTTTYKGKKN